MFHRTGDKKSKILLFRKVLDLIRMVAEDGRSKNRPGPKKVYPLLFIHTNIVKIWFIGNIIMWCILVNSKVDGRKFNLPGVKKAEHEKVKFDYLVSLSTFLKISLFTLPTFLEISLSPYQLFYNPPFSCFVILFALQPPRNWLVPAPFLFRFRFVCLQVPKKVRVPTGRPPGRPKAKTTEGLGRFSTFQL